MWWPAVSGPGQDASPAPDAAELELLLARMQVLLCAVDEGVMLLDELDRVTLVNDRVARWLRPWR